MSHIDQEIASQPACWQQAAALAATAPAGLPQPGERVAVTGAGTSWFMAQAYAALREAAGHGETDAHVVSEFPTGRRYDRIVAITRSGTTTEVLDLLTATSESTCTTVITADSASPAVLAAGTAIVLPFADEQSVVQTRFATTALILLRAHLGHDLTPVIADARTALHTPLPADAERIEQITFLGRGWSIGLAHEAALKCREAARFWTESYPAMDYRHGPIAIADPNRAVWVLGDTPDGLADDITRTGATLIHHPDRDPLAELILAQRMAVAFAHDRRLNPDAPRHLTRAVILR